MADSVRRQATGWRQARVGLLLIVAIAIVAYAIWRIGSLFDLFVPRFEIVILVPSAAGVLNGAPVTLAGQRIGLVEKIEFLPLGSHGRDNLSIQLSIARRVQPYIRTNSYARIRTQGVLGDKYIDLSIGSAEYPEVQPGDTIMSLPGIEFEDLMTSAANVLSGLEVLIKDSRTILGSLASGRGTLGKLLDDPRLYDEMVATVEGAEELLANLNRADGTFSRLLHDPALYEQLERSLARIDSLGSMILHGGGTISSLLSDDALYRRLLGTAGRADTLLTGLGEMTRRLTEGDGSIQRLLSDPGLYDQFLKTVIDLQILIDEIRADPKKFRPEVKIKVF